MYCLKCGKDTADEKVFCEECLQSMDKYPVKPGTAIQLPQREAPAAQKKVTRTKRALTPEEQVSHLRRVVLWLSVVLVVAVIALGIATTLLITEHNAPSPLPNRTPSSQTQP